MAVRTATLPSTGTSSPGDASPRLQAWIRRPATLAVASLVALPLLAYAMPALFGHPVVPGDDLTQSLPLRQLVGHDLSTGHLPIFDPYLWSGAPLLGGWNAGAAYPLTWLFAVLPASAAWTITLTSAVIAAGVGCYAFLRANGLGVAASWLGGATFAFGGGMSAQLSHIGLVTGMAWAPLALLAILRLTKPASEVQGAVGAPRAPRAGSRTTRSGRLATTAGWTAVLAGSIGLVVLAGEPRAIADAATVLVLYAAWRLGRLVRAGLADRRSGGSVVGVGWAVAGVAGGAVLGIGLGAVQLLPGLAAVATSQRAVVTTFLFSAGSFSPRWLALLGVPDLLGGSGSLGQPSFFASYNLTEVTGYVGMLPLAAAGALLGRLRWRAPLPEWVIWYVVVAAGVLLALGSHTPLWHLLIRIPLFGGQRLQSRSILVTGLGLAVLLAYWADTWIAGRDHRHVPVEDARRGGTRRARRGDTWRTRHRHAWREQLLGTVLPASVVVIVVVALGWRVPLLEWMGVRRAVAERVGGLGPWLLPFLVLAVAATAVVWASDRRGRLIATARRRAAVLVTFVVIDLAVFAVTTVIAVGGGSRAGAPSGAGQLTVTRHAPRSTAADEVGHRVRPASQQAARSWTSDVTRPILTLHLGGRFAVYDPTLLDKPSELGVPDANVVSGTSSVEGYGAIVDGAYARATGTHGVSGTGQDVFAPRAVDDGVFDQLDTTTVLVPGGYLVAPSGHGASGGAGADGRSTARGRPAIWELGTPIPVRRVTVTLEPGTALADARTGAPPALPLVRIGLVKPNGALDWSSSVTSSGSASTAALPGLSWRGTWAAPVHAVAVEVATSTGATVKAPVVATARGTRLRPSGALDAALVPPHWTYAGHDGPFALYRNNRADRPLTLRPVTGGSLVGASVARIAGPALDPRSAFVSSPGGVSVVRAVAAIAGWRATWTPASPTGRARTVNLTLRRDGVVQSVSVPPGRGTLTWHYRAPGLVAGAALSGISLVVLMALVGLAVLPLAGRRRRRRRIAPGDEGVPEAGGQAEGMPTAGRDVSACDGASTAAPP